MRSWCLSLVLAVAALRSGLHQTQQAGRGSAGCADADPSRPVRSRQYDRGGAAGVPLRLPRKGGGGPKWVTTDRYDFLAKTDGPVPSAELSAMIVAMLQDRFQLVFHAESRPVSGFGLTMPKTPPQLKPASEGEQNSIRLDERRKLVFQAVPMHQVANYIQQILRMPVVEHTGMKGTFDFTLDPYSLASPPAAGPRESFADLLREAVEQFGFKLTPEKVTLNFTIIDRIERPSEN